MQLPSKLKNGEVARLIPVISDTRKEQRATSVFLAVMSAVPQLSDAVLSNFGQRVRARTSVNTFTEIVLANSQGDRGDRPDGFIQLQAGRRSWSALVEIKIGSSKLKEEQVERYLQIARDNNVDALITISNQFATLPTHHPVSVPRNLTRRVSLFHISWTAILTEAILLHENAAIADPEQAFLLRELIRFLSHGSVGVNGYDQMPQIWSEFLDGVQAGAVLSKSTPGIEEIAAGWFEETRELALLLSRELVTKVSVKLQGKHQIDPDTSLQSQPAKHLKTASPFLPRVTDKLGVRSA